MEAADEIRPEVLARLWEQARKNTHLNEYGQAVLTKDEDEDILNDDIWDEIYERLMVLDCSRLE